MRRLLIGCGLLGVLVAVSCGSSSPSTSAGGGPDVAGTQPSVSARMICAKEAQTDIRAGVGTVTTKVTTPTWTDHVYSCTYQYRDGKMTLSVKELSSGTATTAYFNGLAKTLGRRPDPIELAQGAFQTSDGSVIVRKDYKVLDVDVSGLPAQFGNPAQPRDNAALSVAEALIGCWTGA